MVLLAAIAPQVGTTDYHAKFFANELLRRFTGDSPEKLATSLADANVDLNPHQVDAALFAFQSPLSNGVILADEVGLGKTIEAGLVISQFWAERKRRVLVIVPANLRKQWSGELAEKFHLSAVILESVSYNREKRLDHRTNPFDRDGQEIVICSLQFASAHEDDLAALPWDLVVIDEAHRLRNHAGKHAQRLRNALTGRKKLLLTATPLQNNLVELWGLAGLIDENFFGERSAFQRRYGGQLDEYAFQDLRQRLRPLVQRTLRRDAREFIKYTERIAMREEFAPTDAETKLYNMVSEYLRRDNLYALSSGQRHLMTMVLRKLLASSTFAIAGALRTMANRLRREISNLPVPDLDDELNDDYDTLEETMEEWDGDEFVPAPIDPTDQELRFAMERELRDLEQFAAQAESIAHNAKVTALLSGLRRAFSHMEEIGANRKALIFTESRRTQQYLSRALSEVPEFADKLVLFDGTNSDPKSREIYNDWKGRYAGTERATGSRAADIRSALVDYFRETGEIMIATEAAAEGINLQFCSLVINYDLPWNPQRIEQRIGRCHRYGQEHDVVVLNFLNKENEADQRVYELLDQKFHLFNGVFGASDEVLGTLESGIDIEKRIAAIYQNARTRAEISASFQQMQLELDQQISEQRAITERKLFENFDEDVAERFRTRRNGVNRTLDRVERMFMAVTRHELRDHAEFLGERTFVLRSNPYSPQDHPLGRYDLLDRTQKGKSRVPNHLYRIMHPLGTRVLFEARDREAPVAEVHFDYGAYEGRISSIETFLSAAGWINVSRLTIEMESESEDHLLLAGFADDGRPLDEEQIRSLFRLSGKVRQNVFLDSSIEASLENGLNQHRAATLQAMEERMESWIQHESDKLDAWADDRRQTLDVEIIRLDKDVERLKREQRTAPLRERQAIRRRLADLDDRIGELEARNREERRRISRARDELLDRAYARIDHSSEVSPLFTLRWRLDQ
jgi:adenine-specific DNA-methyltransferase